MKSLYIIKYCGLESLSFSTGCIFCFNLKALLHLCPVVPVPKKRKMKWEVGRNWRSVRLRLRLRLNPFFQSHVHTCCVQLHLCDYTLYQNQSFGVLLIQEQFGEIVIYITVLSFMQEDVFSLLQSLLSAWPLKQCLTVKQHKCAGSCPAFCITVSNWVTTAGRLVNKSSL